MFVYRTLAWTPAVDVREGNDDVTLAVELPGIEPGAVEITYDNGVLTVKGEKKSARKDSDAESQYHIVERTFGTFVRSFRMPKGLDESRVEARYEHGVLTIRVPKAAIPQPRKIEIKTAA
jgi:HSP20 family protein